MKSRLRAAAFLCAVSLLVSLSAAPRPYVRHKNQNPTAYLSRKMPDQLIWGEILFRSPYILGKTLAAKKISCHSCHPQGAATDELILTENSTVPGVIDLTHATINPENENERGDALRIPSLRGIRYLAPYGHDGRTSSLRDFTRAIIVQTFGGEDLSEFDLGSLVLYMQQFDFLPNPRLKASGVLIEAADAEEKKGEAIFSQSGCVRCHDPRSYFSDHRVWRLSGMSTISPHSMENAAKTATLLRARRARYLHDGGQKFDTVLQTHAGQIGATLPAADLRPLTRYLEALMVEEKPIDERHIAERATELHTWLAVLDGQRTVSGERTLLVLETLRLNFVALEKELATGKDSELFAEYLSGLDGLIAEIRGRNGHSARLKITGFSRRFRPELRFLGTVR